MTQMEVRDLSPALGSEIIGLDPVAALDDPETRGRLQGLFDTRGILAFRDLDVDERTQADLIRMLIGLDRLAGDEPTTGRSDGEPFYVSNRVENGGAPFGRLLFHADMMWSEHTFQVLSLYAVEVEPEASPTLFASATQGWETLPTELRSRVEPMTVVQGHAEQERAGDDPDVLITSFENIPTRTTPVALRHPRTGETILYVSEQMTSEIEGLSDTESEATLRELFDHMYRTEGLYEHHWRHHDLVAWDNIAVQHARPNVTLEGPVRTLRKVYAPLPPQSANPSRPSFSRSG